MSTQVFPTKGNLISTKKSLALATMGYDLMDRKRNILIRELMTLVDDAKKIRAEIETTYGKAYRALMRANVTLGLCADIANSIPEETGVEIGYRSVMGVEIPHVMLDSKPPELRYGFSQGNSLLDYAYICFDKVKHLTVRLAEIDNGIYRLANAIKKTQRRANALKNIMIPRFEETCKYITDALEEKDREEFSRLKVIKASKAAKKNA